MTKNYQIYSVVSSDPEEVQEVDFMPKIKNLSNRQLIYRIMVKCLFFLPILALVTAFIYLYVVRHHRYVYCEKNDYTNGMVPTSFQRSSLDCKLLNNTTNLAILKSDGSDIHHIALLGDSLIALPDKKYGLLNNLQTRISNRYPAFTFDIKFVFFGHIADLKNIMCEDAVINQTESIILYWDSDVRTEETSAIAQYTQDLAEVISTIKKAVNHVALAGPGLIGEAPIGYNMLDECADTYRKINRNISSIYDVSYIDIREAFIQADRRKGWKKSFGYLTEADGHHPSYVGTQIEEDLFYDQLEQWYSKDFN
jgi:hypothetical protein